MIKEIIIKEITIGETGISGAPFKPRLLQLEWGVLLVLCTSLLWIALPHAFAQTAPKSSPQSPASWKQIPIPPLPAFKPQQPKRIELSNGMVIFLQEDHELPLIDGTVRIRGGSVNEPADKTGLVDIYSDVWRTGGTKSQTGDQLDDYLEIRAAKVETGGSTDSTTISFNCLKGDLDDVFKIFTDLLQNPEFRADKIEIAQKQLGDGIARRNDDPGEIAHRESAKLAYGADNPYARVPEYATVAAVTRQDLVDWHTKYVHPNNIILGITGDFDSGAMESRLRAAFESWPKGAAIPKNEIQYTPAKPGYYLINKDDVNQSNIHMVTLGTTRDNPDYYAISVFNEAFGGGFSSRLFNDIRTQRALAYGVGGGVGTNFGHPGILQIALGTKSNTTIEAIRAVDEDIADLSTHPITEEEIQRAKDAILNTFIFRLDSPDKILAERMTYEYYGYPPDWLDKFQSEIKKVTAADVNRVAQKYIHRDQLAVLVVGNTKEFDKPLSSLGAVKDIDITIPPSPGAEQAQIEKPTESNAEGKALAAKVVAALGGESKLAGIKAVKVSLTLTAKTPQGEFPMDMESTIVYPDHLYAVLQTPGGPMTLIITPDLGIASMENMGTQPMPAQQKDETLQQLKRDPVYIASRWKDADVFFEAAGTVKVGDIDARVLYVNIAGTSVRWLVDPANGHILKATYPTFSQSGEPVLGETVFEDWKNLGGLTIPALRKNKQNGEDSSQVEYKTVEINPTIDPKLFEKPADH
jgi:zinc protease